MNSTDSTLLKTLGENVWGIMGLLLGLILLARQLRIWNQGRAGSYYVLHNGERRIKASQGATLLETLREARIPHAAVCGGRARCTTCRVQINSGLAHLPTPNDLEARALERIQAPPGVRLACQLQPTGDLAITPLVDARQPLNTRLQKPEQEVHGKEEYVVAMFVDMRGWTNLSERIMAYDVVFILNRYLTELSRALDNTHGHYSQFTGDGLMGLYGLKPDRKSQACQDALRGAVEMFERISMLNKQLNIEFGEEVKMGIGIHGGEAIVGTMGPPSSPALTAVGDNINIAARLEAQTKQLGCDLIVSVRTLEKENIPYSDLDKREITVRGRAKRIRICTYQQIQLTGLLSPGSE